MKTDLQKKHDIKLLCVDVDGTLTDGKVLVDNNGNESLTFNKRDGIACELLKKKGIKLAMITSEKEFYGCARNRASKLGFDYFAYSYPKSKIEELQRICALEGISLENVAAIGDDINDKALLSAVALRICPADAREEIKCLPDMNILTTKGGEGILREVVDKDML